MGYCQKYFEVCRIEDVSFGTVSVKKNLNQFAILFWLKTLIPSVIILLGKLLFIDIVLQITCFTVTNPFLILCSP